MPIAGVPRNPLAQRSNRFHRNRLILMTRRQDVVQAGRANPGTIRRLWQNVIGYTGAAPAFSWTRNGFEPEAPVRGQVSSPLRYLISTVDTLTAGNQLSNPMMRPVVIRQPQAPPVPLTWAGNVQGRPTVRNRIRSLGSRVPPLNAPSPDATPSSSS
jgi:hypothetical protein